MEYENLKIVLFISAFLIFLILGIFITLYTTFHKKKVELIIEQKRKEKEVEEIINKSEIEIKENAFKNIAWELHDNVGQLLSLARLELNILAPKSIHNSEKIKEISDLIGNSLQEIRSLSKTFNAEYINSVGLKESIKIEIDRFNRMNYIDAQYTITGDAFEITNQDEIVLFRMIQEFFSNTIKHSKSTRLCVNLNYTSDFLIITVEDNGIGFNILNVTQGSGLLNMRSRAKMIKTKFELTSDQNGTKIKLLYPKNRE